MFERNKRNLLFIVATVLIVVFYLYSKEFEYRFVMLFAALNLIVFAFRRDTLDPNDPYQPFIDKPLEEVQFTDQFLTIKEEQIALDKIEKIVLELETGRGILQLPYNNGGKVNIAFPAKYLFKLKRQFEHHLPDVEYIS